MAEGSGDYDRDLGVIEAITFVTRSCPSGAVIACAERALEEIRSGGAAVMKQQAYFVLVAIAGWRGERARQVHRSLTRYLAEDPTQNDTSGNTSGNTPGNPPDRSASHESASLRK